MLLLTLLSFLCMWGAWLWEGENLRLPIATVIFYILKMVSDSSLLLAKPDLYFMGPTLRNVALDRVTNLFLSNCDPWVGNALMTFIFAFLLNTRWLKALQIVLSIVTMVFVLLVLIVYHLSWSFSYFSAIIAVLFAFIMSFDLNQFWEKWNQEMLAEGTQTAAPQNVSEIQPINPDADAVVVESTPSPLNPKAVDVKLGLAEEVGLNPAGVGTFPDANGHN